MRTTCIYEQEIENIGNVFKEVEAEKPAMADDATAAEASCA